MSASNTVVLHPKPVTPSTPATNPLPPVLKTPAGLALLELQGTVNVPQAEDATEGSQPEIAIGRLDFPDYNPDALDPTSTAWMRRVYMYVGQHQRLTGEVKKLPKPVAVVRRRSKEGQNGGEGEEEGERPAEELEIADIVKYKLVFSQRPEPVGTAAAN